MLTNKHAHTHKRTLLKQYHLRYAIAARVVVLIIIFIAPTVRMLCTSSHYMRELICINVLKLIFSNSWLQMILRKHHVRIIIQQLSLTSCAQHHHLSVEYDSRNNSLHTDRRIIEFVHVLYVWDTDSEITFKGHSRSLGMAQFIGHISLPIKSQ